MAPLSKRREAFEFEYTHGNELLFLRKTRRTRLFALDMAESLGMNQQMAEQYSGTLLAIYAESGGDDESIIDRVLCDLHNIGVFENRAYIASKLLQANSWVDEVYGSGMISP